MKCECTNSRAATRERLWDMSAVRARGTDESASVWRTVGRVGVLGYTDQRGETEDEHQGLIRGSR